MTVKKILGILVAIGIAVAMAIEFWTFGQMIWTGLVGTESTGESGSVVSKRSENDRRFAVDSIDGSFNELSLTPEASTWLFSVRIDLSNSDTIPKTVRVRKFQLSNGQELDHDESVKVPPGESRSLRVNKSVPPGTSPNRILLEFVSRGAEDNQWMTLPKIPVRAKS